MTRSLWMMMALFGVILPAFTWIVGGELFPSAPASVTFSPPPTTTQVQHIDDARLREVAVEMGLVPAQTFVLNVKSPEIPGGPCEGLGHECEGEARTALPDPWETRIGWLQDTWTEFQWACEGGKTAEVDRMIDERNSYRRELAPACWRMSVTSRPDEFNLLCAEWRC